MKSPALAGIAVTRPPLPFLFRHATLSYNPRSPHQSRGKYSGRTHARLGQGALALRGLRQCAGAPDGRLFHGRFGSVAMDEDHLMAAALPGAQSAPRDWSDAPGISPIPALSASGRPRRRAHARTAAHRPSAALRRSSRHRTRTTRPSSRCDGASDRPPLGDDAFLKRNQPPHRSRRRIGQAGTQTKGRRAAHRSKRVKTGVPP